MQHIINLFPWYLFAGVVISFSALVADGALTFIKNPDITNRLQRISDKSDELRRAKNPHARTIDYSHQKVVSALMFVWLVVTWPYQALNWMLIIASGNTWINRFCDKTENKLSELEKKRKENDLE